MKSFSDRSCGRKTRAASVVKPKTKDGGRERERKNDTKTERTTSADRGRRGMGWG